MPEASIKFERAQSGPNEVFAPEGGAFPHYRLVLGEMEKMGAGEWDRRVRRAYARMLEEQRRVGIPDRDRTHPIDYFPRVIPAADWGALERGLSQRMLAINEWLRRVEAGKDEVVPREIIESSALYDASIPTRFGSVPNRQIGFDVVAVGDHGDREYLVIEDNAKMPVGLEPMTLMRARTAEVLPEAYAALGVRQLDGLMERFGEILRAASPLPDPTLAILSTGPEDQYYLDHKFFARELDATLAERHEVEVDRDGYLVHKKSGRRLDVVYERIESGRIYDDLPGLIESQASGKIEAVFAPNLGIADDKGVYPFIPEMVRTYLGEEPILRNADTRSLALEDDLRYVMDHFDELVIKSRSGWGGKDVLIAPEESQEDVEEFRKRVQENPIEYVAQTVLEFSTHVLCESGDGEIILRDSYADYRVHALAPDAETVEVVPGADDAGSGPRQQARQHLQRRQDEGHLGTGLAVSLPISLVFLRAMEWLLVPAGVLLVLVGLLASSRCSTTTGSGSSAAASTTGCSTRCVSPPGRCRARTGPWGSRWRRRSWCRRRLRSGSSSSPSPAWTGGLLLLELGPRALPHGGVLLQRGHHRHPGPRRRHAPELPLPGHRSLRGAHRVRHPDARDHLRARDL